eukprot:1260492-Rhodomonas_salina.1
MSVLVCGAAVLSCGPAVLSRGTAVLSCGTAVLSCGTAVLETAQQPTLPQYASSLSHYTSQNPVPQYPSKVYLTTDNPLLHYASTLSQYPAFPNAGRDVSTGHSVGSS